MARYLRCLAKDSEQLANEEVLTRRSGLMEFLTEANDCQKAVLR